MGGRRGVKKGREVRIRKTSNWQKELDGRSSHGGMKEVGKDVKPWGGCLLRNGGENLAFGLRP